MTKKPKAKVLIVDDHAIVRQGITLLINQHEDFKVCGEAADVGSGLEAVESCGPDVVIIDISLTGGNGIELIKTLKGRRPNLPMLVLSMHDETLYAERALRAGAMGYVMKEEASDKVITALRRVLGGELYLSDKMTAKMLQKAVEGPPAGSTSPLALLSDRELEVFQLIGQGIGTRKIAEKLALCRKTVETHRHHIKKKLKLKDANQLFLHAVQWVQGEGLAVANSNS